MAFEVFDDVAFFYLALSVLAVAVLPWTCFKVAFGLYDRFRKPDLIPLTRIQKLKLAQKNAAEGKPADTCETPDGTPGYAPAVKKPKALLSVGNVCLALLWFLFIYMLLQIPSVSDQKLTTFKPYEILGIEGDTKGVTEEEIKRAYRKQSLKYHPDRNPSEEAAQQFILIAKAYETLTSPTAKANIEKYGNPDGYQGVSVTIGLPSMLTKKENEMRVLMVYFFLFIVLPPIVVWSWWRRAKDYMDGGLMKKTYGLWYQFLLPNTGSKFLIELLTIAAENEVLLDQEKFPTDVEEFKKLATEVKPKMMKQRFQDASKFGAYFRYSQKASVLLHAYLLRIPTPKSFIKDMDYLLKEAHRFLNTMLELALGLGYVSTVFGIFDLMQLVTQGCFPHDSAFLQLPHLTPRDISKLNSKNIKSMHQLLKQPQERLNKILPDMTETQWNEIRSTAELIPDVDVHHSYSVEDEEGLYEGDVVTLKVKLERTSFNPDKPEHEGAYRMSGFDGDEETEVKEKEPAASPKGAAASSSTKKSDDSKEDGASSEIELTTPKASGDASPSEEALSPRAMTDDEILDSIPIPNKPERLPTLGATGPSVHSLTFPHPKHERWYVLLIEKSKKADRIIGFQKVNAFFDEADVELKFPAPRAKTAKEDGLRSGDEDAGVWKYELHAICDSYIGVDRREEFTMKVSKPRASGEELERLAAKKVEEEYKEITEAEELEQAQAEEWGPWYFLYFPSFWEMVLNIVVLVLLGVFIFNFLVSRGYWAKYVQPFTSFIGYYTSPVFAVVYPYLQPVVEPVRVNFNKAYAWTSDMLHRDPFPKHPDDLVVDENAIPGMGQDE